MAGAFEGFSIREYAAKMRTVDVVRCWPFGGGSYEIRKEDIEASLPPITVKKFTWWSDELELARSSEETPKICVGPSKSSCYETALGSGNVEAEKMEVALELSKSRAEKLDIVCPVCRVFTAATAKAVNSHFDGCPAHASKEKQRREMKLKAKSRTPKKRSIVEIFAVAPQVERADDDDDDYEGEDSSEENDALNSKVLALCDVGSVIKSKAKMKKKKKAKPKLKDETKSGLKKQDRMKIVNMGPKSGRDCVDRLVQPIAKKGKPHALKLQSSINFSTKPNCSSCSKGSGKQTSDAVSIHKKKQRIKFLAKQKKRKLVQTSKMIKHHKSVLPVRGILKNRKRGMSGEYPAVCSPQIASQVNLCGIPQTDRHVRFSDKDDMLGPRRKPFPSIEGLKLQNVSSLHFAAVPASSVKDHAMERGKDLAVAGVSRREEDISITKESEMEIGPVSERQSSDTRHLDIPNFLRSHMGCQEHLSDKSMTLNQVPLQSENLQTFEQGFRDVSLDPFYACSPRFPSLLKVGYNPSVRTQVGADILRASMTSDRLVGYQSEKHNSSAAVSSMEHIKASPQPPSYFAINGNPNGRLPCPVQNTPINCNAHAFQYQSFSHLSPKELMRSICSFPDWKQRAAMAEDKSMEDNFCGLPLNSQGELIQLNSGGKVVFNQMMRPTSTAAGSSMGLSVPNILTNSMMALSSLKDMNRDGGALTKEHLKAFPVRNYEKEKPNLTTSSRLDVSRSQATGKTKVHCLDSGGVNNYSVNRMESDLEQMNMTHFGHKQYSQVQKQIGHSKVHRQGNSDHVPKHVTQSTMRLMGIEFTVCGSANDLQASDDGKVWTDKQIIAEHHPISTANESFSLERQSQQNCIGDQASGKFKGQVPCLLKPQISQSSQNGLQLKPSGYGSYHPYIHCKTDTVFPNRYPAINGNQSSELHPYIPSAASSASLSQTPIFQEPFVHRYESPSVNLRVPKMASTRYGSTSSSAAEPQKRQILSAFEFPFLHPDRAEHVQPSWFQSSSKSLPAWLLNATQQKETPLGSCQPYSDARGRHQSCALSGSSLQTIPSVQQAPKVVFPHNPASYQSAMQNSRGPASLAHHPRMPPWGAFTQTSAAISKIHGDSMKLKQRMSPKVGVKELDHTRKTRKRPAAMSEPDQGKKTRKRPTAKSDDKAKRTKTLNLTVQEDSNSESAVKASMAALELLSLGDKSSSVGCIQVETPTEGLRVSPVIDPFKVDGFGRSGPIKLSAGAKHILKPNSNLNQDNSRPTHSTIPFAAATGSVRVSESEKKSAQIYRF